MRKYVLSLSVGCACLLVFSAITTAETWTTKWEQLVAAAKKEGKVVSGIARAEEKRVFSG